MGTRIKRPERNSPSTSKSPRPPPQNSDSDFLTEDEEVNKRLEARKLKKKQILECFHSGLTDYGITKSMERAAG